MVVTILVTYCSLNVISIITDKIKRNITRKKTIKMFEDNGYDVNENYMKKIFEFHPPYFWDRDKDDKLFCEIDSRSTTNIVPIYHISLIYEDIAFFRGDYSDERNEYYSRYFDWNSVKNTEYLEKLKEIGAIKENRDKMKRIEQIEDAKKILDKEEISEIDILASKYDQKEDTLEDLITRKEILENMQKEVERKIEEKTLELKPSSRNCHE